MSTVASSEFEFVTNWWESSCHGSWLFVTKTLGLTNSNLSSPCLFTFPVWKRNFYSCTYTKKNTAETRQWGSAPTFETQENSGKSLVAAWVPASLLFSDFHHAPFLGCNEKISASHIIFLVIPLSFLVVNPPHNLLTGLLYGGGGFTKSA